ncbi:BCD family MFS transporter [Sphingomonas jaspsi]|uniref:BCD family MFS transporter n=1 Tax=Sphingomonas jaspsi TaxID=392409 RepID=UPI0004B608A3|nr:BCD family MFS transporter [Sphingomonas jaspsi]
MSREGLGWATIARLGVVQASIGAIVMLATSLLNRVMVVEYHMAAAIPAGLVAWHYAVQLSRPIWGHGSDRGRRRTPWVVGGMAILGIGALLAVDATILHDRWATAATLLSILAFTMIGAGVGASGTSVLALLATGVAPERRAAAAALTWIMMVAGIVVAAGTAGALLDPFSPSRLALVAGGVVACAVALSTLAMIGLERRMPEAAVVTGEAPAPSFAEAVRDTFDDPEARRFTLFIFLSMLAYSMQDLILEPFAGLIFAMTPAQSTSLSGIQHGGVLAGMILCGIGGSAFFGRRPGELRPWIMVGCLASAIALAGLASAAATGSGWPLEANVFLLGMSNGVFAVSAIGAMMGLAGAGDGRSEGIRMGVWGAAQAIAFGLGGLSGALGVDLLRSAIGHDGAAFQIIFGAEATLFLAAAVVAVRVTRRTPSVRLART